MQDNYEIFEYSLENNVATSDFINDSSYENESAPLLTHPPTRCPISQPNNILSIIQMLSNSIKTLEENINRQHEQVNELKDNANQLKHFFIAQQQQQQQHSPVSRRINRNHTARVHPYLNERPLVSSRTPTIRSAAPTYHHECFTTEQLISSNGFHHQQANVPAETADNNEIFSAGTQNYGFW